MIRSIGLFCVLCLLSLLTSCHTTSPADQDLPPYNPNVEAFTTGKISRYSPVYLIFNQEIPAERLKADRLGNSCASSPMCRDDGLSRITGRWYSSRRKALSETPLIR